MFLWVSNVYKCLPDLFGVGGLPGSLYPYVDRSRHSYFRSAPRRHGFETDVIYGGKIVCLRLPGWHFL